MRKIINSTYITLDGVVAGPHIFPLLQPPTDPRANVVQAELIMACDAVLMGRKTYESFAPVWQSRSGDPIADRMNTLPKYVVSTTLQNPDWANTSVVSGDVAAQIGTLKEQPGQDIVQYGIGPVTKVLMEHGLLDEFRLWLLPHTIGKGEPGDNFFAHATEAQFRHTNTDTLSDGHVILTYELMR